MNKFKIDAEILGSIRPDDYPSQDQFIVIGNAADLFDYIATLANEAPDAGYLVHLSHTITKVSNQVNYVLQEYAEYWQQKCAILVAEKQYMGTRIKQLEDSLCDNITEESQAIGLYDKPKPLMSEEDLDNIATYVDYLITVNSKVSKSEFNEARKHLCGE